MASVGRREAKPERTQPHVRVVSLVFLGTLVCAEATVLLHETGSREMCSGALW